MGIARITVYAIGVIKPPVDIEGARDTSSERDEGALDDQGRLYGCLRILYTFGAYGEKQRNKGDKQ